MMLERPPLHILHLDEHIVVVHKPSGLLVHKSLIDRYETEFLIQRLRDQIGQQVFLVHRLDKPTSGLMVLALHKEAARKLSESFANNEVEKQYQAMLRGFVSSQTVNYPLIEKHDKMTDSKAQQDKEAQSAITDIKLMSQTEVDQAVGRYSTARFSLVSLTPHTGRKHQLRRHMAHIRHPILGDTTHGDGKQNAFAREFLDLHRLALIAKSLSFQHPISKMQLSFTTSIDDNLKDAWQLFD